MSGLAGSGMTLDDLARPAYESGARANGRVPAVGEWGMLTERTRRHDAARVGAGLLALDADPGSFVPVALVAEARALLTGEG